MIPDIIATKRGAYLLVESKSRFSRSDVAKVLRAVSQEYADSLAMSLELQSLPGAVIPALAFAGALPARAAVPAGLALFVVHPDNRAVDVLGTLSDAGLITALLPDYRPME